MRILKLHTYLLLFILTIFIIFKIIPAIDLKLLFKLNTLRLLLLLISTIEPNTIPLFFAPLHIIIILTKIITIPLILLQLNLIARLFPFLSLLLLLIFYAINLLYFLQSLMRKPNFHKIILVLFFRYLAKNLFKHSFFYQILLLNHINFNFTLTNIITILLFLFLLQYFLLRILNYFIYRFHHQLFILLLRIQFYLFIFYIILFLSIQFL